MDRLHAWRDRTRLTYVVVAVVLALIGWRAVPRVSMTQAPHTEPRPAVQVRTAPVVAAPMVVHVVGAVRRPGVYRLQDGSRLMDAVRKAGGPRRDADLAGLNLAAPASDGQQVVVPVRASAAGAAPPAPRVASGPAAAGGPVSLSRATAAELEALDGIGPALAQRIVDWRDANGAFGSVDDLLDVPGIGEARLEALRARVVP